LGTKPSSRATASTFSREAAEVEGCPESTREAVAEDTPAACATSLMVTAFIAISPFAYCVIDSMESITQFSANARQSQRDPERTPPTSPENTSVWASALGIL